MRRGGLGRGLAALIPGADEDRGLVEVPVDSVRPNPRQPRTSFAEESLGALARSIQEVGILQPIVVRPIGGGYELVAGERRLRAARLAGLSTITAIVREGEDSESLREALIENIHRDDLAPLELAAAFQELQGELGVTQEALAARLGHSRAHVANTIRLLSLPADVQRLLAEGRLQAGHARALLSLDGTEAMSAVALRAAAEGLSVRQVESLVKGYADGSRRRPEPRGTRQDPAMAEVEELLSERLSARVHVSVGKRKGRIVVEFGSSEDLERLVSLLSGEAG